jgi:IS30 family transposase
VGHPAKFTVRRRELILDLLRAGASRRAAARAAGVHHTTLVKWLRRGEQARHPESQYACFREEVLEAEGHPEMRALRQTYDRISDNPDLAWRFIDHREPGQAVHRGDDPDGDDPGGASVITLRVDG